MTEPLEPGKRKIGKIRDYGHHVGKLKLRSRIRELEAALETKTTWWLNEKARAEKAEKERNDWERTANENGARVAELERMEEHWHNRALLLARGEPLAAIERGEREAD